MGGVVAGEFLVEGRGGHGAAVADGAQAGKLAFAFLEVGLGFHELGFLLVGVELEEEVAFFDVLAIDEMDAGDALGDLGGEGDDLVGVDGSEGFERLGNEAALGFGDDDGGRGAIVALGERVGRGPQ